MKRITTIRGRQAGFTIIELAVVIAVIGILATITIVSYTGAQNRAHDTTVEKDLRDFGSKVELFASEHGGRLPLATELAELGWRPSEKSYEVTTGNALYCAVSSPTRNYFSLGAKSRSGKVIFINSTDGIVEYNGDVDWNGAYATSCPPQGVSLSETGNVWSQGFQPSTWGQPGWNVWAKG